METSSFPPLATHIFNTDHIFLRVTQKKGDENKSLFHLLDLKELCLSVEMWAKQEVNFFVKQHLSLEDEMKQQECRYFLFCFKKPLVQKKPERITFPAGDILNICDILEVELDSRPWMLFKALFGNFLIRLFPKFLVKKENSNQEEDQEESEPLSSIVPLSQDEFTYYLDESEPKGAEEAEINLWLTLQHSYSQLPSQAKHLAQIKPKIQNFIGHQQATKDRKKFQTKFMEGFVKQNQMELLKSKAQTQKVFQKFDFLNNEKLKQNLDN